jgi:hypothetical protein
MPLKFRKAERNKAMELLQTIYDARGICSKKKTGWI